jgi:hypothetical protein
MKRLKGWQKFGLALWFLIVSLFVFFALTQRYPVDWTSLIP